MQIETISGFRLDPAALEPGNRLPGVSAFLRTRNGADFLEATIRSHVDHFDEIVAVFNDCSDATPDILARLAQEFGPRLRVYHYAEKVHPPGSAAHAAEPGDSPHSLVAYSNCALALTRYRIAVKLDDDHLAIPSAVGRVIGTLRAGRAEPGVLHCFSGPNLARGEGGALGIPAADPVSGGGDIGFFEVSPATRFEHDRRFERFARGGLRRRFAGWLYWHLKYLKTGGGFANYALEDNPASRFARKRARVEAAGLLSLSGARRALRPPGAVAAALSEKAALQRARDRAFSEAFPQDDVEAALDATSPGWRNWLER
ncbi:MAG: hypothetical protein JJU40_05910 [Rhodobacteraceae bacterium]|nr:hypothetical protein [Paracoccaceae bacterium]